jgi:hypothetical protein
LKNKNSNVFLRSQFYLGGNVNDKTELSAWWQKNFRVIQKDSEKALNAFVDAVAEL